MSNASFSIANRAVGPGHPTYIIAEMSANHLNDFGRAKAIVDAAAHARVDAIKLQTYRPDTITIDGEQPYFKIGAGTPWEGRGYYELYEEAHMAWDWQPRIAEYAHEIGLHCFSSPFDSTAVDFLEEMDVPAYKIASFEIVDIPLIEYVAATGKPVIMSTGMATEAEIETAVTAARGAGAGGIALLKCTSAYPAPPSALNLRTLSGLAERFEVPVGLSDHTLEDAVVVAAVTLGACIVEKHITLSRADGGPDSEFSLEPDEFRRTVDAVRLAEEALGSVQFGISEAEQASRKFRRSLFVVQDVAAGEVFSSENLRSIRPGDGLPPKHYREILGRRATQAIERGTPLHWDLVAPSEPDSA